MTKRTELPMTKTEKTAMGADGGEQSGESKQNYRFVKIEPNIKSIDLSLLIQDMITQKVMCLSVHWGLRWRQEKWVCFKFQDTV